LLGGTPRTGRLGLFDRSFHIGGNGGGNHGEGDKTFHRKPRVTVNDHFGAADPVWSRKLADGLVEEETHPVGHESPDTGDREVLEPRNDGTCLGDKALDGSNSK
jgi:hypothetical protein